MTMLEDSSSSKSQSTSQSCVLSSSELPLLEMFLLALSSYYGSTWLWTHSLLWLLPVRNLTHQSSELHLLRKVICWWQELCGDRSMVSQFGTSQSCASWFCSENGSGVLNSVRTTNSTSMESPLLSARCTPSSSRHSSSCKSSTSSMPDASSPRSLTCSLTSSQTSSSSLLLLAPSALQSSSLNMLDRWWE